MVHMTVFINTGIELRGEGEWWRMCQLLTYLNIYTYIFVFSEINKITYGLIYKQTRRISRFMWCNNSRY